MSYIQNSLGDGETVIAHGSFPWFYGLRAWGTFLIPLAAMIAAAVYVRNQPGPFAPENPTSWGLALLALWALVGLFTFLRLMIRRASTEIGITTHRFVEKYGIFSMRTNEIALHNIEGVKVNQTFAGRIFSYGTVTIEGTGVDSVTTPVIGNPVGFVKAIQTARERLAALDDHHAAPVRR